MGAERRREGARATFEEIAMASESERESKRANATEGRAGKGRSYALK